MTLEILDDTFAILQVERLDDIAGRLLDRFVSVTKTGEEFSVVCREELVPSGVRANGGWRVIKVHGPLDLAMTGVLASLATPLAQAGISIFAISTYDTDYLLVPQARLADATECLIAAGHSFA